MKNDNVIKLAAKHFSITEDGQLSRDSTDYPAKKNMRMGVGFDHQGVRGYKVFSYRASLKGKARILTSHRMVFYLANSYFPDEVDHIDNDRTNNHPSNLRAATRAQNTRNKKSAKNSSSVFLGVSKHSQCERWQAEILVKGKRRYLGLFKTPKEAASHYNLSAIENYGEFANLNDVR